MHAWSLSLSLSLVHSIVCAHPKMRIRCTMQTLMSRVHPLAFLVWIPGYFIQCAGIREPLSICGKLPELPEDSGCLPSPDEDLQVAVETTRSLQQIVRKYIQNCLMIHTVDTVLLLYIHLTCCRCRFCW